MPPKKKRKPAKVEDRHRSGFMIRLPEPFRAALEQLHAKHRRPMTVEVQIALEKHFRDEGVKFPPRS